jgi:hypothetical protein
VGIVPLKCQTPSAVHPSSLDPPSIPSYHGRQLMIIEIILRSSNQIDVCTLQFSSSWMLFVVKTRHFLQSCNLMPMELKDSTQLQHSRTSGNNQYHVLDLSTLLNQVDKAILSTIINN